MLGASKADVRGWRQEPAKGKRLGVSELLSMAIRHFLLIQVGLKRIKQIKVFTFSLKVGVVEQVYVGHAHARPWLLHSFKVN